MRYSQIVLIVAALVPSLASAQFVPQSGDLQANTYATGSQDETVVAADPNTGAFVVVWTSATQDGSDEGVFGQRFGSDGTAAGSEFQVNTNTSSYQSNPAVAVDSSSGDFVVVWQSYPDGQGYGVFGQRFGSDGTAAGSEFQVNTQTFSVQRDPAVGVDPSSGNFVVAWQSYQDGSSYGVFGQRFGSDGTAAGSEFQINTFINSFQGYPAVGVDPSSGAFVVAWQSYSQDGIANGVFGQRFGSDGTATGSEFQVNSTVFGDQKNAAIAVDPSSGAFVVAWQSFPQDGSGYGVAGQRFGSDGTATGSEFQINTYTYTSQLRPAVGVDPSSGAFVVAWQSYQDGSSFGVFGQRFGSDGAATGSEFQVNQFTLYGQSVASVAPRGDGQFAIGWTDNAGHDGCTGTAGRGVFGQRFGSDGTAAGGEFQINTYTIFTQREPALGVDPNTGAFVVAWQSRDQDGSNYGVFGQRFGSDGTAAGSEFQVNTHTNSLQSFPVVGMDPNTGAFVVAWQSHAQDGSNYGVFGQRFGSDGAAAGSEFQVNTYTSASQRDPALGVDPSSGGFVVAWTSYYQDGGYYSGVFGQRFGSDGTVAGSEFQINTYTPYWQSSPAVGVNPSSGDVVLVWGSYLQDGSDSGVFGQRFGSDGTAAGSEFQINTYTTYWQSSPAVGVDSNSGAFVVAWVSNSQDGSNYGVFGQRFGSDGTAAGSEFQVSTYTNSIQQKPAVGVDPNTGAFVVAWQSYTQDGNNYGVFGQRYGSDGAMIGSEFQINTHTNSFQAYPAVGVDLSSGSFVVAWDSNAQDGCYPSTGAGAFVRLFGEATATATATTTGTVTETATQTQTSTATATTSSTATVTPTPPPGTSATCPAAPAMGCAVPTKGKLIVKDNADNAKDKLVWKFGKGPQLVQADFGNPVTTNGYAFCVYDDTTLKIDLTIPSGTPWEDLSTKGYQYKDSGGGNDGVTKVKLIGGDAGKSKLQLKGKGAGLGVPAPASGTQLFSAATSVVVQLHGNGDCWETAFTSGHTHKPNSYKGKF